jgi:carbon monoxide dehydrogenase subunit G
MILRNRASIDRTPEEVWHFIEDPLLMRSWNLTIREIVPASLGERGEGFRYRVRYTLGRRKINFETKIMEHRKPFRFVLHLSGGDFGKRGYIQEIYELSENRGGTLLKRNIEVYESGLNIFRRLLVIFLHRFARPAGKKYLMHLKKLAETGTSPVPLPRNGVNGNFLP